MATKNAEPAQTNKNIPPAPPLPSPAEQLRTRVCNTVFKTGPLFISSRGIGWTSWKKRWFILTRTSLVFFRSDPSAAPIKGSEVNLTLGGIDLNNSGSVVVKEDKKLLTVLFPDGRDGRTFTLKAETLEDLQEWKTALENALAQAPNHPMGQNGIFRNDQIDSVDGSLDQFTDRCPIKVPVIGRPILLALEDVDGSPSFLEKALQYIEEYGVKVEGILRQAADVEDVESRIKEYEQGKNEFSSGEDAHVIGDCVKFVLRELPSSPVPASSCKALLQACRTERSLRVNAMRTAICETFPEPNRRLLQRILMMMQKVASHKAENRMSYSAVAACMAPLLLRPLLAGECEIENDFDLGGDGSAQLLQAAAAANHAQAIVITLLDEYDKIFAEGSMSPEPYTDSEESGSGSEEATDDESYEDDDDNDDDDDDNSSQGSYPGADDLNNASSETCSESGNSGDNSPSDDKHCAGSTLGSDSPEVGKGEKPKQNISTSQETPNENALTQKNSDSSALPVNASADIVRDISSRASSVPKSTVHGVLLCIQKSTEMSNGPVQSVRNRNAWGRTAGRKNLSMESIDYGVEDEFEIQRLEVTKSNLESRIAEEVKENAVLQTNLEIRKKDLHQRRLALERDVARLQEQLKKQRDLRAALEAGLNMSHGPMPNLATIDEKTKADLEEIALAQADVVNLTEKLGELGMQLNQQHEVPHGSLPKLGVLPYKTRAHQNKTYEYMKDKHKDCDISPPHFDRSRIKDPNFGGTEIDNKDISQSQQQDPLCGVNHRSIGVSSDSSTDQSVTSRRASSRRSFTKNEGTVSTNSALTKLTTRLNFLKERRTQIAYELQNMDKNLGLPAISQNLGKSREPLQNTEKSQASEAKTSQNPEKGRESDSFDLFQNVDRGLGTEGQPFQSPDRFKKAESHSLNYTDRGKRSNVQNSHSLDRGKSDNHLSLSVGKGRVVESGQLFNSSRTSTR